MKFGCQNRHCFSDTEEALQCTIDRINGIHWKLKQIFFCIHFAANLDLQGIWCASPVCAGPFLVHACLMKLQPGWSLPHGYNRQAEQSVGPGWIIQGAPGWFLERSLVDAVRPWQQFHSASALFLAKYSLSRARSCSKDWESQSKGSFQMYLIIWQSLLRFRRSNRLSVCQRQPKGEVVMASVQRKLGVGFAHPVSWKNERRFTSPGFVQKQEEATDIFMQEVSS